MSPASSRARGVVLVLCLLSFGPPAVGSGRLSGRCDRCHLDHSTGGHPVGVPYRARPGTLTPSRGIVACETCHATPTDVPAHVRTGVGAEPRAPGGALCSSCHRAAPDEPRGRVAHGLALGRAHLGVVSGPSVGLDHESRTCLSCHDGVAGPQASVRALSTMAASDRLGDWRSQHPVGIPYAERLGGRAARQLRPVQDRPAQVRLFDGRLGCGSCHDPYSANEGMLVAEKQGGRLCLTCHVK